ncbi:hypothetical protein HDU93_001057 [Gonapodya sp. JEL0774]|nr:hypothetical protein HDU93_001057 [Gonapodya sp. JEL0774]
MVTIRAPRKVPAQRHWWDAALEEHENSAANGDPKTVTTTSPTAPGEPSVRIASPTPPPPRKLTRTSTSDSIRSDDSTATTATDAGGDTVLIDVDENDKDSDTEVAQGDSDDESLAASTRGSTTLSTHPALIIEDDFDDGFDPDQAHRELEAEGKVLSPPSSPRPGSPGPPSFPFIMTQASATSSAPARSSSLRNAVAAGGYSDSVLLISPTELIDLVIFVSTSEGGKGRLRKVAPPTTAAAPVAKPGPSPEEAAQQALEERQALFFSLLEYMEAPEGNLDELVEKLTKATATARGFVYSMIKRGWVEGWRVMDGEAEEEKPALPVTKAPPVAGPSAKPALSAADMQAELMAKIK